MPAQPSEQLKLTNKKYLNFDDSYCDDFFDGKYVVQLLIDSVVDYDLPLKLNDLKQIQNFGEANFFVPEGHAFDVKYAEALNKAWNNHLISVQQNGVSAFDVLSKKGSKHFQQRDFDAALQIYEEALEVAESVEDLSWMNFFDTQKQRCLAKLKKAISSGIEKVVEIFPDEVDSSAVFREGAVRQVSINSFDILTVLKER